MIGSVGTGLGGVPTAGSAPGGGSGSSSATTPIDGAALPDASVNVAPGTDNASRYTMAPATMSANRTDTVVTTGTLLPGQFLWIRCEDLGTHTLTIVNGGLAGGTLYVFGPSMAKAQELALQWDGVDWQFVGVAQVVSV